MIDRFLIALCHHHFLVERQFVLTEIVLVLLVGLTQVFNDLKSNVGDVYHFFCCDNKPQYFAFMNSLKR